MIQSLTEKVAQFIAEREDETHTEAEWEALAVEIGLNQGEIDELFWRCLIEQPI